MAYSLVLNENNICESIDPMIFNSLPAHVLLMKKPIQELMQ